MRSSAVAAMDSPPFSLVWRPTGRGWEGTRSWHAIEHGLTIEATHHGNRARLLFIVRPDPDSGWEQNDWELRLPLLVAPGESLARIATAARTLFGSSST